MTERNIYSGHNQMARKVRRENRIRFTRTERRQDIKGVNRGKHFAQNIQMVTPTVVGAFTYL
jgi:hypothetical protein